MPIAGDKAVVQTQDGPVSGDAVTEEGLSVRVYRGIPYAAPPVGDRRWRPPAPVEPWEGVRDCTRFSLACPQAKGKVQIDHPIPQGEDCLTLNVVTPAAAAGAALPVMVWLHGGALLHGNGNEEFFNAPRLPAHGVVVVTVNMRVGPMGLIAHPRLSAEAEHGVSGNYLLMDMIQALQWVRDNIAAFGGNPGNVTIFGESGGGAKVVALMCSPAAGGLFHRAAIESGGVFGTLNGFTQTKNEAYGEEMFRRLGVADAADPLAAARALPWEAIIEADAAITRERDLDPFRWDWTVDGHLLPDTTEALIRSGRVPNLVPLLAGCNLGEIDGTGSPFVTFPSLVPFCTALFDLCGKRGLSAFAYLYDHVPHGWRKTGCVSYHRLECGYLFGDWDDRRGFFASDSSLLARVSGATQADPELGPADRTVAEMMMTGWTAFARSAEPRLPGGTPWPGWDAEGDRYTFIVEHPEVRTGFSRLVDADTPRGNLSNEVYKTTPV